MKDGIIRSNTNPPILYSPFVRMCISAMPIMAYVFKPSIPSYRSTFVSTSFLLTCQVLLIAFPFYYALPAVFRVFNKGLIILSDIIFTTIDKINVATNTITIKKPELIFGNSLLTIEITTKCPK